MKRYQHLTEFDPPEAKALKDAKARTKLPINRLVVLCVQESLDRVCGRIAPPGRGNGLPECDWNGFLDEPRRKVGRFVADEVRAAGNRR